MHELTPWQATGTSEQYVAVEVTFLLSGANPTVTISGSGAAQVSDDVGVELGLQNLAAPAPNTEAIGHYHPVKDRVYPDPSTLNPDGGWQGKTGGWLYKVRHEKEVPGMSAVQDFISASGMSATGKSQYWSSPAWSVTVTQSAAADWYSNAYLQRWNGSRYEDIRSSSINFKVHN
jgi:hypothetical protein